MLSSAHKSTVLVFERTINMKKLIFVLLSFIFVIILASCVAKSEWEADQAEITEASIIETTEELNDEDSILGENDNPESENNDEFEAVTLREHDTITLIGTISVEWDNIDENNNYSQCILTLDYPEIFSFYNPYLSDKFENYVCDSVQIDFEGEKYTGKRVKVTGNVMFPHTMHHLRDIILVDCKCELTDETDFINAYKNILRETLDKNESGVFCLVYIDDDNIPELVVAPRTPVHMDHATLYSYNGKNVVKCGEFGEYGCFEYLPNKDFIKASYLSQSEERYCYYQMSDNNSTVFSKTGFLYEDDLVSYKINNVDVSEEEYKAELEKCESKGEFQSIPYDGSSLSEGAFILSKESIDTL